MFYPVREWDFFFAPRKLATIFMNRVDRLPLTW
jgi:hypothetical protein